MSEKPLLALHKALRDAIAIGQGTAGARGYFSAMKRQDLDQIGFRYKRVNQPALVIPCHAVNDTFRTH